MHKKWGQILHTFTTEYYRYDLKILTVLYWGQGEVSVPHGWCGGGEGSKHFWPLYVHSKVNVSSCDGSTSHSSFAKCFCILGSWRQKISHSFISPLDKRQTDIQTRAWLWMEDSLSGSGDVFTTSEPWTAFVSLCTLWSLCNPFNSPSISCHYEPS